MRNNKKILIVGVITLLVIIGVVGGTFAFFIFANTSENQVLVAGDVFMKYTESNTIIDAQLMMPRNEYDPETYFEFTIEGKNTYSKDIYYEILINHGEDHGTRKTRLADKFLRFRLEEIIGEEVTPVIEEGTYEEISNTKIWVNTIKANTKIKTSIKYKLYMWITDEVNISDSGDYTNEKWNNDVFASIKVSVNGDFEEKKLTNEGPLIEKIRANIKDTNSIIEDETIYLSGDNETINFNYVWYSGKLWRITSINPDGTIKLITENSISATTWSESGYFYGSWIYQWLNEDFKDTLYNYQNIIVKDVSWNSTTTRDYNVKIPGNTMIPSDVGLLNAYEYYLSYKKTTPEKDYLKMGDWWLLTPYSTYLIYYVSTYYKGINYLDGRSYSEGIRPVIVLKPDIIVCDGTGSKEEPYRLKDDIQIGKKNEKINSRVSGEYVNLNNNIYRIVEIMDNGITKLSSYYPAMKDGSIYYVTFSSQAHPVYAISSPNSFLNSTWVTPIKNYLVEGEYYTSEVGSNRSKSYKSAICYDYNTKLTTKTCTKSYAWTGLVGLPRLGEMFSVSEGGNSWLITPSDSASGGIYASSSDDTSSYNSNKYTEPSRPSITLKSEVIITGGDGMSIDTAYTIALPE